MTIETNKKALDWIQGLRLIGIITIVAGHAGLNLVGGGNWCTFFFLVSGFLYKTSINNWHDYKQYVFRKLKTIFPVYWFCLGAYLLLAFVRGCEEQYTIHWDFPFYLLLVQTWIPSLEPMKYLGPSWFLSSLLFCYLLSPIVKSLISRKLSIIFLILAIVAWHCLGGNTYISPFYRILEYAFGMWLSKTFCSKISLNEPIPGLLLFFVSLIFLIFHFGVPDWSNLIIFSFLLCVLYIYNSKIIRLVLGNRYVVSLSKSNMFIYLTHAGIGFHIAYYFISTSPYAATLISVIVGYVMFKGYSNF